MKKPTDQDVDAAFAEYVKDKHYDWFDESGENPDPYRVAERAWAAAIRWVFEREEE